MSTDTISLEVSENGVLWVAQFLGATLLLIAGSTKLSGVGQMSQTLDAVGVGQWLCAMGIFEFVSAFLLLIPPLSGITALLLVPNAIEALLTQVLLIDENPTLSIGILIITSIVAWGRKETTLRLISRLTPKEPANSTDDCEHETEFMTISYGESVEAMSKFTGADPTKVRHLERDNEFRSLL